MFNSLKSNTKISSMRGMFTNIHKHQKELFTPYMAYNIRYYIAQTLRVIFTVCVSFELLFLMAEWFIPNVVVAYGRTLGLSNDAHPYDAIAVWGLPMLAFVLAAVGWYFIMVYVLWKMFNKALNKCLNINVISAIKAFNDSYPEMPIKYNKNICLFHGFTIVRMSKLNMDEHKNAVKLTAKASDKKNRKK